MTGVSRDPDAAVLRRSSGGRPLKIDIVVHGRFHAFHLARALIARGHDVRVLTNYPKLIVTRFGLPRERVVSYVIHGLLQRLYTHVLTRIGGAALEPTVNRVFGRWAARNVRSDSDLIYIFSGVAEEVLRRFQSASSPNVWLVRGSSHIRNQHSLLVEEELRAGVVLEKPSAWNMEREEREYELADRIVTLSSFSHETFLVYPRLASKTVLLRSAVDARRFQPASTVLADRLNRIRAGAPLRILTVGAFSCRKGAVDMVSVAESLSSRMHFRFVGDLPIETRLLRARCEGHIELFSRVPEFDLVGHYAWADIFLFPTIEDGFPAVVAQALASGLPVLTTPNGSGPDIVEQGRSGWIVPIRSPDAIVQRLSRADEDRPGLCLMVEAAHRSDRTRDWSAMAADLEHLLAVVSTAR